MQLNAQGSKAISQFLGGCDRPPPWSPPLPRTTWLIHSQIVSSSFSESFTLRYRKISQLSSKSRIELQISTICEVSPWLHAGHDSISVDRKLKINGHSWKSRSISWSMIKRNSHRTKDQGKKQDRQREKERNQNHRKQSLLTFVPLSFCKTVFSCDYHFELLDHEISTWDQCKQCHSFRFG